MIAPAYVPDAILARASVLVERAEACAAGFRRLGNKFSADLSAEFAKSCREQPATSALFEHWITENEKRLARMERHQGLLNATGRS